MHRPPPLPAAVLAVLLFIALPTPATSAATPEAVGQARSLLEKGQAGAAVQLLEETVADATSDQQPALLEVLRQAYAAATKEAMARGQTGDAEQYRDNLEILNHTHPAPAPAKPEPPIQPKPEPPSEPRPEPPVEARPETPAPAPVPLPAPTPYRARVGEAAATPSAMTPVAAHTAAPAMAPAPAQARSPDSPQATTPEEDVQQVANADAAFRAKRYDEAGKIYATLDREGRLPPSRRDHWAYCRWTEVVRRINAKPATPQEWAEIDAEIQRIRALSPNNWYGEYLRNRAAERPSARRTTKSNRLLVRGSAPDEPPLAIAQAAVRPAPAPAPRSPSRPKAVEPKPEPARAAQPSAAPAQPAVAPAGAGQWQVRETPNFRVFHDDPELAVKAAEVAEAARESQLRRWVGSPSKGPWTPKCDLYLYPTAATFSQMTGQPEQSPGFSTMGMNGGKIIARRINLRVDHPNLLKAILPHEITHVVLADLFPNQQIPRWADEGMAVLAEPSSEQQLRASDLDDPLSSGQLFKLEQLMTMDYPDGKFWGLYYAQSVSLTRFLVEQGTPAKFIQFVQRAQLNGAEAELKRIYNIDGYSDLHSRWVSYARTRTGEATASSAGSEKASASAVR
jgi:hypothetical protein